jgi:MinD-like ATPase involved in chromosome partitioning or flagellar assembly
MVKVLAIASTKGGVGKTFVSVNLAAALKRFLGKEVLVIDGNISAPNLALNIGIVNPSISIQDVINNENLSLEHAIEKTRFFDLIAGRVGQEVNTKEFDLKKALEPLKDIYDYIIIDTSPNMNWETKMALDAADEIILVSNPDYFSISNLMALIGKIKKEEKDNKLKGIILNRVLGQAFEIKKEEIEDISKLPVLAQIPFSISVLEALAFTEPVVYYKPYSKPSRALKKLGEKITGEKIERNFLEKLLEVIFG